MLYNNMIVLEFLVFVSEVSGELPAVRQQKFLNILIDIGLEHIALSQISSLSDENKLLIELLVAAYSDSTLVIFNVMDYTFSVGQAQTIKKLCSLINSKGSVIIGTNEPKIIGVCCDKVAYILEGKIKFFGTVDDLCSEWDKVLYLISDIYPLQAAEKLQKAYGEYTYIAQDNSVLVYNYSDSKLPHSEFLRILFDNGILPDNIKLNKGRVENSFEELKRQNDI